MGFFLNSPLEQFEVFPIKNLSFNEFVLELDWLFLQLIFILILTNFAITCIEPTVNLKLNLLYNKLIPQKAQFILEEIYSFLLLMLLQQTNKKGEFFFPILCTIFTIILLSDLNGLFTFSFTLTSSLFFPFFLAIILNFAFAIFGFYLHSFRFLKLFLPSGIPLLLKPLILVIEIVSYLIRSFSLSLRLFANIMAGHSLLNILSFFVKTLFLLGSFFSILAIFPFFLVVFVYILEVGIAFLQAYVFSILLCIYLNDSINLH